MMYATVTFNIQIYKSLSAILESKCVSAKQRISKFCTKYKSESTTFEYSLY